MGEGKQLTVDELVKLLKDYDQNLLVFVEGCDCVGEAAGVEEYNLGPREMGGANEIGLLIFRTA